MSENPRHDQSQVDLRLGRPVGGVENILWEADFPHPTSTYPDSRKAIETSLARVPPEEQALMLHGNAVELFRIDLDETQIPESVYYAV